VDNVSLIPATSVAPNATRVLVADDDPLARRIVREQLEAEGFSIVGEARDGEEAVTMALRLAPDVVVMDLLMPRRDGIAATQQIVATAPQISVVVLSLSDDQELGLLALRAGAVGFLEKDISMTALVRVIRGIERGEAAVNRAMTRRLISEFRAASAPVPARPSAGQALGSQLSAREEQVLGLLVVGLTTVEISGHLELSRETVRTHVRSILRKLRVRDRVQAVVAAYDAGLVRPRSG